MGSLRQMVPDGTESKIEREKRVKKKDILSFRAENNPVGFRERMHKHAHKLHNASQAQTHTRLYVDGCMCFFEIQAGLSAVSTYKKLNKKIQEN